MKKIIITSILAAITIVSFAQNDLDTLLVRTDKNEISVTKYFVVNGCKEMIVHISNNKCDTTFYDDMSELTREAYIKELKLAKLRQKPISQIYADDVFNYFEIKDSITNVTKRLRNKKIHVTPRGYEVAFYNKFLKRNEIFEFTFFEGKLSSISRASINTLPTNDVWLAFQLMPLKEELNNLEIAIKKMRARMKKK